MFSGQIFKSRLESELQDFKKKGGFKTLNYIQDKMGAWVTLEDGKRALCLCANNYLGLAGHPEVIEAGKKGLDRHGAGTASVRFICGSFEVHRELEVKIASFLETEAALTYVSCWNANSALLPAILRDGDFIISDELNHASIIDAIRLCSKGVQKRIYPHANMEELEKLLKYSPKEARKIIVTDGVFSMEGDLADLPAIRRLADLYGAVAAVDDSHGTGVLGKNGRGTAEHFGLSGKIEIITGTLGKSLGGAAGGFVAGCAGLIELLIQKSRPHIFSNALPQTVASSALKALELLSANPEMVASLRKKTRWMREQLKKAGFNPLEGESAIIPILVGETRKAIGIARALLEEGLFVIGFGYPVVPEGKARLRLQISEALSWEDLEFALEKLKLVGKKAGL